MSFSARVRLALLMTFAVYPVVVVYASLISTLTPGWEFWQRSFLIVPLMATTIVFFIVPFITTRFGAFIAGRKKAAIA
jgi:antibiotic biosynthesis monooxygenase (ABM) superfamily enzyme